MMPELIQRKDGVRKSLYETAYDKDYIVYSGSNQNTDASGNSTEVFGTWDLDEDDNDELGLKEEYERIAALQVNAPRPGQQRPSRSYTPPTPVQEDSANPFEGVLDPPLE